MLMDDITRSKGVGSSTICIVMAASMVEVERMTKKMTIVNSL